MTAPRGFYGAFWRRPDAYLDPSVRAGISVCSALDADDVSRAVHDLTFFVAVFE